MESLKKSLSDPTKFGSLMWYLIHNMSRLLDQDTFILVFNVIIQLIPCDNCKNHSRQYLEQNPIELYKDIYDENTSELIGMFKWTWKFHNAVNLRLNKSIVNFDVAIKMYDGKTNDIEGITKQCLEVCGIAA